jgi:anti-anti-sigma regulatory factor
MNLQVTTSGDFKIVSVTGRIDTTNAGEFERPLIERNYISSSGLRVFLVIQKRIVGLKGSFRLCSLQPGIKEIFDISGFSSIFSVYPDTAAAQA